MKHLRVSLCYTGLDTEIGNIWHVRKGKVDGLYRQWSPEPSKFYQMQTRGKSTTSSVGTQIIDLDQDRQRHRHHLVALLDHLEREDLCSKMRFPQKNYLTGSSEEEAVEVHLVYLQL